MSKYLAVTGQKMVKNNICHSLSITFNQVFRRDERFVMSRCGQVQMVYNRTGKSFTRTFVRIGEILVQKSFTYVAFIERFETKFHMRLNEA